jgi:hypothetical protein
MLFKPLKLMNQNIKIPMTLPFLQKKRIKTPQHKGKNQTT